jgi:hypothetical protein
VRSPARRRIGPGRADAGSGLTYFGPWRAARFTNQTGVYGSPGTSAPGNVPGARDSAAAWATRDGSLWLFGGEDCNGGAFNDLWRFSEQPPAS